MSRERSSLTRALINIGAALGGALGVSAVIRTLAGSGHPTSSQSISAQQKDRSVGTRDGDRGAVKTYPAPEHPPLTTHVELRPGWHVPEHLELPEPTYWPAVLAFGITLFAWGLMTSLIIVGIGLLVFAVALAGWIGDLRHGH
jgi:hypothetical protein